MDISLAAVLPQIFTGLVLGMLFVLLAIGLSLIFGLMTVVNFSHGALYMLGAYFTVFVLGYTRNFWVALLRGAAHGRGRSGSSSSASSSGASTAGARTTRCC